MIKLRENRSPTFTLFCLDFKAQVIFIFKISGKVSSLFVLMVGFEHLSQECPSVSFFFARLGVFLEHSSGRCPQLGSFVSRSSAIRPVLFTLYPLICQSLVRYYLEMDPIEYRVDDVRSNELETSLSSNAESLNQVVDTTISKLPSTSTLRPLHALSESCSLEESHLKGYRKRFQFLKGTSVRLPRLGEKACNFTHEEVCFYVADFLCSLRFLVHPFIMQVLDEFQIALGQLVPNVWRTIISCMSIWL